MQSAPKGANRTTSEEASVTQELYDIVVVGGGLGGSTLARAMAESGARVLVLERETRFRDRVRGESIVPWGAAEARMLGLYDLLRDTCGNEAPTVEMGSGLRDLPATTAPQMPMLSFYHPHMQELLLEAAG